MKPRSPHVTFPELLRNRRGVALLYLVILFTLLGILMSFGARKFGALVTEGKIKEAKTGLERDVQMIVVWSVKNGRLPTSAEYPGIFGSAPVDAWGKPVVFAYYSSLTKISTGGICGRTSSAITYNGQDVAFLLLSGGDDMNISSTPGGDGVFNGALNGLQPEDLYRIVTLNELSASVGCPGATGGALKILNNELPGACKRRSYSATIFADGGVAPYARYSTSGLPVGISNSGASIFGTSTTATKSYTVGVTVVDSVANTVKKSFLFKLMTSCN